MAKRFSDRIIEFMGRSDYRPVRAHKLARVMSVADAEMGEFRDAVDALRRLGRVIIGANNAVMLGQASSQVVGVYRANPRGFGFVVPDEATEHGDLYIPQGESGDALTGDRVICSVLKRGKRDGKQVFGGRILKVVERGNSRFVGALTLEASTWYVQSDGNTLHSPILIGDPHAKGARSGDQVVVELVEYPREGRPARGVIVERLGRRGDPGVDLAGIIEQYQLPDAFPEEVLDETRRLAQGFDPEEAVRQREDLSGLTIVTIDPDDARDFDDAISLTPVAERSRDGDRQWHVSNRPHGPAAWEVGVHIADVSHFVRIDSELDKEAVRRGTSIYLPGRVIPMLPEILSNGLCSLQENEPRLCKSAFIRYDRQGRVVSSRFANTLIRSSRRLTYGAAQEIIDGRTEGVSKSIVELVLRMDQVARAIRERRISDGMIVLELPAVDLVYDPDGRVIDARPEDTSFSHTIIEMFMVEANEAVARRLSSLDVPFLRRIHPPPEKESVLGMAKFMRAVGLKLPKQIQPSDLQVALDKLRGKPEGRAVNLAVLKSMQSAEYSPKQIGHFALASDDYAHFTSPIRRYPDLMVHRLLDLSFDGQLPIVRKRGHRRPAAFVPQDELTELGRRMSFLARRAESAERELKTLKVLSLLAKQVGEGFEGVVTGVTQFGLFVQHPKYLIDGLIRIEDLGDDWWDVDIGTARIRGQRNGKTFTLGTRLSVVIAEVDLSRRQLSLGLPDVNPASPKRRHAAAAAPRSNRTRGQQSRGRSAGGSQRKTGPKSHRKGKSGRRR
ncbi:MAG: ribonuclease R [Phycisphaerae bacterium]|nr:ribonuclease R [Phycisphaerae bacterium]